MSSEIKIIQLVVILIVILSSFSFSNQWEHYDLSSYKHYFTRQALATECRSTGVHARIFRAVFTIIPLLDNVKKNYVCSPISAILPLGKLALGAEGQCYQELINAIGVEDKAALRSYLKTLVESLRALPGVTMQIISRIYVPLGREIDSQFRDSSIELFGSSVELISFLDNDLVSNEINHWVAQKTYEKINGVVHPQQILSNTSFFIVNALYFKGDWAKPFKVVPGKFRTLVGRHDVQMLYRQDYYNFTKNNILRVQARVQKIFCPKNSGLKGILHNEEVSVTNSIQDAFIEVRETDSYSAAEDNKLEPIIHGYSLVKFHAK